jgi:hypothetical protein
MNTSVKTTDRQEFIDGYCKLYEQHFGGPYLFNGGKDGSAVKRFLAYGYPVNQALDILSDAFTRTGYPYDGAVTMAGFVAMWPRLLAENAKRTRQITRPLSRFELRQQIDIIRIRISQHPHNPESVRHDPSQEAEIPLKELKRKLTTLEDQLISV